MKTQAIKPVTQLLKTVLSLALVLISESPSRADVPSTHGMLLFGDTVTFASHLPMLHAPHDYQVVLQLELQGLPRSQTLAYYESYKKAGKKIFTLEPEVMDLVPVIEGTRTQFSAQLYVGHFEKQGAINLGPITVQVKKVVIAQKIDVKTATTSTSKFIVFGTSQNEDLVSDPFKEKSEFFALHFIHKTMEGQESGLFDQVLKISAPMIELPCRTRVCGYIPAGVLYMSKEGNTLFDSRSQFRSTIQEVIFQEAL